MATLLTKDVARELHRATTRKGETLIATMKPGDILEFRAKGKRTRFQVPLAFCYNLALILESESDYKERMKRYKERKSLGLRSVRPRRPGRVFSDVWYKAMKL